MLQKRYFFSFDTIFICCIFEIYTILFICTHLRIIFRTCYHRPPRRYLWRAYTAWKKGGEAGGIGQNKCLPGAGCRPKYHRKTARVGGRGIVLIGTIARIGFSGTYFTLRTRAARKPRKQNDDDISSL